MVKPEYTPSDSAIALLKEFEQGPKGGFAAVPYRCPAGRMTIGWGHVILPHDRLSPPITAAEADALLRTDLEKFANGVTILVKAPLAQSMFDALCCFAFNLGLAKLRDSTLLKKLNRQNYSGAADEFQKWNKGHDPETGKLITLPGLTRRRAAERKLFLRDTINPH